MTDALPGQAAHVFPADLIWVVTGANQGDGLGLPEDCETGDLYQLERGAEPLRLMLAPAEGGARLAAGSEFGRPGDAVSLRARHVLMAPDGDMIDVLMIVHEPESTLYALPLSPMAPRVDYTLIESLEDPGEVRLADLVCVAFTTGTMITMASGAQRPIESLGPGDRVLTRDSGPQPIRWIGKARLKALGSFAPVVIAAGTLGNEGDLIVSPHHRIFLYQRGEKRLGATAEVLVQAKHLVDGENVWRREGGYVDYYSLVFDRHEIIYAEGIPCESLMVSEKTLELLPEEIAQDLRARFPGLAHAPHFGSEAGREVLDEVARAAIFRSRDRG
ncbi:Hint domain-containing protein [Phaeovulum vinaykumarii]|uniref:Hint domain-containing protein n=1 Tax=Phaeovulum vinaykumarii TaxID=407234 RepID=A0A1N7JQI5_9RHOB|nr:Hint domain-containing protein [Phaeovulum vinaykumarii]SIS51590.1 Hint domain-containing protein [Phaeovulum vinaykumarii]SOB90826.1 Hint domain-containing protein [Phaeovulum vinaykumarii]